MGNLRIMAIYAHPADVACEASGTLTLHAEMGDEVTIVVLSEGYHHHPHLFFGESGKKIKEATFGQLSEFKREEVRRMAGIMGARNTVFMDWNHDFFENIDQRTNQLRDVILQYKPDVVVTHFPAQSRGLGHVDENAFAGVYALRAIEWARAAIAQIEHLQAHTVQEVYFFIMDQSADTACKIGAEGLVPDIWVDITPVVEKKVQIIDQMVSQGYEGDVARKIVEAREGRWGMHAGVAYAEPFFVYRGPTLKSLPVSDAIRSREYVPNNMPGPALLAHKVALATDPDAYRFPR